MVKESTITVVSVPKISSALTEKLKKVRAEDPVRVGIWLKASDIPSPGRPEPGSDISAYASDDLSTKSAIAGKQKPVKELILAKNGTIVYASPLSPLIFAEMKAADVKDLESRSDIAGIDLEHTFKPTLDHAMPAINAPYASSFVRGAAKIAVVDGNGIAYANPYLKDGVYKDPANPNIGSHATMCAGVIGSTNDTMRGIGYKSYEPVLSANAASYNEADLIAAMDWAVANGARVLLNAWGATSPDDGDLGSASKHCDYLARAYGVTIVAGAGNNGDSAYPLNIVAEPAKAFNVIAVGSFKNQATGWLWSDDVMSTFSSWGDPSKPSGTRMKPEVVASGETVPGNFRSTLTASPWIGWLGQSGTSLAAAAVSGEATLLMNQTPWLASWPEAVKAVIMASATHNIEGDSRKSEYDGVGGVNAKEAVEMLIPSFGQYENEQFGAETVPFSSGSVVYLPHPERFTNGIFLTTGQHTRAVIVWDSRPTADNSADALNADFDLYIERKVEDSWIPESSAGYSISSNNNFEIIEFNAPITGYYRLKVVKYSWLDPNYPEYVGWAVWKSSESLCGGEYDICPPGVITSLNYLISAPTYLNWTWVDPTDNDFDHVMVYLNGTFRTNVTKEVQSFHTTGLTPNTTYTIGTHTVDTKGNLNLNWVNMTARTPDKPPDSWTSPGGHTGSSIAMDARSSTVEGFAVIRGTDNHLYFNRYKILSNTWSGWTSIGGTTYDEPVVAYTGNNYVHVVIRGTDNGLYYKKLNLSTNTWDSSWTNLGGHTPSAPTLVSWSSSQIPGNPSTLPYLWLAIRETDNHLYLKRWTPATGWDAAWQSWGGTTNDRPALAYWLNPETSNGIVTLGIRGTDNKVYTRDYTFSSSGSGSMGPWTSPGGTTMSPPVIRYKDGVLHIVIRGADNHVYYKAGSNPYIALGGTTSDMPAVYSWPDLPFFEISIRGTDSKIYDKVLDLVTNQWTGWTDMTHTAAGHPTFSRGTDLNGVLVIRGTDNGVYVKVV